ncbi:hypothetical protein AXG93_2587s1560 [Marchantia polymorpha subsp. ruderalis]|uniref:Uncharacterized protein n=1 Tax=Marchantia polymorpha subsp. ruderalis TaxID=1480154 RepID=A0A176WS59_MARPO|nr:hypothetical protein AXG93_2587s1560 [Marchantia polymorpha subsp. ruderalis]
MTDYNNVFGDDSSPPWLTASQENEEGQGNQLVPTCDVLILGLGLATQVARTSSSQQPNMVNKYGVAEGSNHGGSAQELQNTAVLVKDLRGALT